MKTNANNPVKQHEVPKTYLKQFSCEPKNKRLKSFVECLRIHPTKKIERKSINSDFFKTNNFYTTSNENPYQFEEFFSREIEPTYNEIISEINKEISINQKIRENLILWIWISKYRNSHWRTIVNQHFDFLQSTKAMFNQEAREKYKQIKPELDKYNSAKAKEISLNTLLDQKHLEEFMSGMATKHWIVLKSNDENLFITNDNPGFSVNIDMGKVDYNSVNVGFATNHAATNYYPLSPKYCLMISPFWQGTPLDLCYWNIKIRYVKTNDRHIDFINATTYFNMRKYCVGSSTSSLNKYLEIDLPTQIDYSNLPIMPIGGVLVREGEIDKTKLNRDKKLTGM